MKKKVGKRSLVLGATALVLAVLPLMTLAQGNQMMAQGKTEMQKMMVPLTKSVVDLRLAMRDLWVDHYVYTYLYIVSSLADLPDASAVANRLLRNQDDIGNAIKPIYGDAAGTKLTELLKAHIMIATEVVKAAVGGNAEEIKKAQAKWTANADDIAAFLSGANPHWPKAALLKMLQGHLDNTTQQAVTRIKKDWTGALAALDAAHVQMNALADALTDGIVMQFPDKFKK